jgi:DNA polymerase-3 subunit epsilon
VSWFRRTPLAAARWVAIDCETSGLDPASDRLLSVGAVAVSGGRIELGRTFGALVRQAAPSPAPNILVHGIGGDAQLAGLPSEGVVRSLAAYVGDAIPAGFHAAFDQTVLRRHGFAAPVRWIDLAALIPVHFPDRKHGRHSLDDWLDAFAIPVDARHDAVGDAFSTAQLLLVALAEARRQGIETVRSLRAMQRAGRWLDAGG